MSKGRRQTKRDTKTDAGSSVISSDLKHRANDARDGLSSYSNRRDQSGLNGCCTVMWKANGKTTTLSLFLDSLFPKTEIPYICEMLPLAYTYRHEIPTLCTAHYSTQRHYGSHILRFCSPLVTVQNIICGSAHSCSPDAGHNDARNMLR